MVFSLSLPTHAVRLAEPAFQYSDWVKVRDECLLEISSIGKGSF
jgi:hypothetical protein